MTQRYPRHNLALASTDKEFFSWHKVVLASSTTKSLILSYLHLNIVLGRPRQGNSYTKSPVLKLKPLHLIDGRVALAASVIVAGSNICLGVKVLLLPSVLFSVSLSACVMIIVMITNSHLHTKMIHKSKEVDYKLFGC